MRAAASTTTPSNLRLQQLLDSVDLGAAPRIALTHGDRPLDSEAPSIAVLDSSFNPPTRAHMHMLAAAQRQLGIDRSLLLLAKQNADKPVVGASLVQRLEMMSVLAAAAEPPASMLCGVTAHPLFVDKAAALQALCGRGAGRAYARIVLLVGYDTWIRVVDPKYYPPGGMDAALKCIFADVEIIVASREASSASNLAPLSAEEQEAAVRALPDELTRDRLHFLRNDAQLAELSSSALRDAVAAGEQAKAREMLPSCLHSYVEQQGLYRE